MAPPILLGRLASVQHKWINNNGNSWLLFIFIFVFVLVLVVIVFFLSDLVDSIIVIVNNSVIGNHEFRPSDTTDKTDRVSRKSKEDIGRRCLLFVYSKMVFVDDLQNVCESSSYRWTSTVHRWSLTIYANVFTGEKEFLEDESQEFRDRRSTVHRVSPRIATMEEIEGRCKCPDVKRNFAKAGHPTRNGIVFRLVIETNQRARLLLNVRGHVFIQRRLHCV